MSDVHARIIEKIYKNRISTTEIADCLGKKGVLPGIKPLNRNHFCVGRVFLAYAYNESNWELHQQLETVSENDIVVVESHGCGDKAIFGELVSKYLILYKGARAIAVNGLLRDVHWLYRYNFPVWCAGITPVGCYNKKNDQELDKSILLKWKEKYDGAIAVCDEGGVVIIPKENINEDFLEKLDFIEIQEDIWHYCIDTKKWSTYDTVCLKKYLNTELLPKELSEKLKIFLDKMDRK